MAAANAAASEITSLSWDIAQLRGSSNLVMNLGFNGEIFDACTVEILAVL